MKSQITKAWKALAVIIALSAINEGIANSGKLTRVQFHSKALEGNLLGDSPKREVIVYLPPSYKTNKSKRYPVVYLLHGNSASDTKPDSNPAVRWVVDINKPSGRYNQRGIKSIMDSSIENGGVKEMIVVMPNGRNKYRGSHYVNSPVSGNWADHIARDLVSFIDGKYRTIKSRDSRALAGYSMGGRGTLILGMKYPDVFGAIYAMSGGIMNFENFPLTEEDAKQWKSVLSLKSLDKADSRSIRLLGLSAAFSPNPNSKPFFVDFQYRLEEGQLKPNPEVQERWLKFDPVRMVDTHKEALLSLNGFRFDCGRVDFLIGANRALAKKLKEAKIPHQYDEYDARHGEKRNLRLEQKVLPYFSGILKFEEEK